MEELKKYLDDLKFTNGRMYDQALETENPARMMRCENYNDIINTIQLKVKEIEEGK